MKAAKLRETHITCPHWLADMNSWFHGGMGKTVVIRGGKEMREDRNQMGSRHSERRIKSELSPRSRAMVFYHRYMKNQYREMSEACS